MLMRSSVLRVWRIPTGESTVQGHYRCPLEKMVNYQCQASALSQGQRTNGSHNQSRIWSTILLDVYIQDIRDWI